MVKIICSKLKPIRRQLIEPKKHDMQTQHNSLKYEPQHHYELRNMMVAYLFSFISVNWAMNFAVSSLDRPEKAVARNA